MKKRIYPPALAMICAVILSLVLITAIAGSEVVTTIAENAPLSGRTCFIIDAGHGGVDGGATSCTGILESAINLEIALRLDDLMHLLGMETLMIRKTDISVYTEGNSIAAKKVSDLKERARIVNQTENAVLISIHQNHFSDSRYSGPQVFYSNIADSEHLGKQMQSALVKYLNPQSNRQAKKADGVYLMQNIHCSGILIECGFLSNPSEEARLRSPLYQKQLCCVIASVASNYENNSAISS